jgi:leucyl aminopeptidase (aminopeptidase T)
LIKPELFHAALKLVRDVLKVRPGEEVAITADSDTDPTVVEAVSAAAKALEAKPVVLVTPSPPGVVGKAADPYLPLKILIPAIQGADVWIEFNKYWLLYSSVYEEAMRSGRVRYMCLVGMTSDMMIRLIGRVDIATLYEFQRRLAEITRRARRMRIVSPAGTDIEFENDPRRPVFVEGEVKGPGEYMLFGQVDWAPVEDTLNGVIVFDGSLWPPEELGLLTAPVRLEVRAGTITRIEGGREARTFEAWLRSFRDPRMFRIAHIAYGCNPGARLTGNILEDERVWGVVEWGIGSQAESFKGKFGPAPSHADGIILSPTVWADGQKLIENGSYVHPELKPLEEKLRPYSSS